ncbi:MAG: hypothetical protein IJF64_03855 [Clostridia bacterium]|nr:hypothetical protein [Clostridia bacterium]
MTESIQKLKKEFEKDLTDYAAIPFWSWNNELDEKELIRQIEEMKAVGMGGFIMHARLGITTEYLGEKWFSCIGACLKKAKELGMNAWIYDENGWPSGFVGGKLLKNEDYLARFLEYEVKSEFDESAFCVFRKVEKGFERIKDKGQVCDEYHSIYLRISPANTDILNPDVTDAFIKETHEKYYERFPESFGKELVGFFTDEPQYYRWGTPYTPVAEKIFKERYGEEIQDGLVYLFVNDENGYPFRNKYYKLLNELYVTNFYKKLYDWCEAHHCKLTGHSLEEGSPTGAMIGGADCLTSYEYEHIPGIDWLGRGWQEELSPKQLGSVASQLGIKQTLTETYGCSGYDATPREFKGIGECQFFNGVNLMCHHLYPYSISGQGRYDHPPVFSRHSGWFKEFKTFNDYFTRLGYICANTQEDCDVLVIHPQRGVYLDFLLSQRGASRWVDDEIVALQQELRKNGVQYHYADETLLAKYGNVDGDTFTVGKRKYKKVIVPAMKTIAPTTLALLEKFQGKLLVRGELEYLDGEKADVHLSSNTTFEEIVGEEKHRFRSEDGKCGMTARTGELGEFIFIKNYSTTESATCYADLSSEYKVLDLITLETKDFSNDCELPMNGGLVLIKDETAKEYSAMEVEKEITQNFQVTGITDNYLVLDYAEYSLDGKEYFENQPLPQLFEKLLRMDYKGKVYLRQTFISKDDLSVRFMMEKENVTEITLNGEPLLLEKTDYDVNYVEADCKVKSGENVLEYTIDYYQHDGVYYALFDPMATESLRNCLYYDTHIEPVYFKGEFTVGADLSIEKRKELPALSTENYKNGYPFFAGEFSISGEYDYDGNGERVLSLVGRFMAAEIVVNGKSLEMVLSTKIDITKCLKKGKNKIEIRLKSSLRNLYGPHHFKPVAEPLGVSPTTFTMRGGWKDGVAVDYTHTYNSVPFGVGRVEMIEVL